LIERQDIIGIGLKAWRSLNLVAGYQIYLSAVNLRLAIEKVSHIVMVKLFLLEKKIEHQ